MMETVQDQSLQSSDVKDVVEPNPHASGERTTNGKPFRAEKTFNLVHAPRLFLAAVLSVVFLAEAGIMFLLPVLLPTAPRLVRDLTDSVVLVLLTAPFIWILLRKTQRQHQDAVMLEHLRERERRKAENQIRCALDWREAIFNGSLNAVFICDTKGRVVDVNRAACELACGMKDDLLGSHIGTLVPEFNSNTQNLAAVLSGETLQIEGKLNASGGTCTDVECHTRLVSIGTTSFVHTSCKDITARRKAERQQRLQAAALNAAANSIVITDRAGTVEWANPAFGELTGYTAQEMVGQNLRLLRSGEHDASFYKNLWQTILAGRVWRGETINRRKDGSLYTEEMTVTPVISEHGVISHFVAVKEDISERKRAEEALRQAEEKYRGIFEENLVGILQTTPEGRVLSANPALVRILGYESADEMIAGISDVGLQIYTDVARRRKN